MKKYKTFDILGPIMVGPSSSHTAGACKIANAAIRIGGKDFTSVDFLLHGSFATTYKGHGTDKALLAGVMGFLPNDKRIADAFGIAKERNINYTLETADLGDVHPNTVKIILHYKGEDSIEITGSSVGGGNIVIVQINQIPLYFKNEFPTLIFQYHEQKGIISYVSTILTNGEYNIESINTKKENNLVTLVIETERDIENNILELLIDNERFIFSKYIRKND